MICCAAAALLVTLPARAETQPTATGPHWAFQPVTRPAVPEGVNPVDHFIREGLKAAGLFPNPEATPLELLRRLHFDLTGLPPTLEELAAFEADTAPDRLEKVVERLLASPRHGERWGRHWLDVVRYTESQGFEYDHPRANAWPYRDYVIRAFNDDVPYDRFMREQIAGDVIEPVTSAGIVATSLLVCGPWDQAGNSQSNATQRATTREEEMEDLVSVVGQTFLGLTVNCARCHDHKFDPIPQTDYYSLRAVFDGVKHGERPTEGAVEARERQTKRQAVEKEISEVMTAASRLETEGAKRAAAATGAPAVPPGPVALARWTFDGTPAPVMPGTPMGGAVVSEGRLQLPKEGAYFQTPPLPRDVREKTLEAWVSLADLKQGGGAAISLESADGTKFDAIVFGEREPGKWTAGSDGFVRTKDLDAPAETTPAGEFVHVAAVYAADNSIALYRNGEPCGRRYTPAGPLQTWKAGDAHIALGRRHKGGGRPWLTGSIRQAALYDRALSTEEIAASFRSGGSGIPLEKILAALNPEERTAREAALKKAAAARESLAALAAPPAVAYAGTRVQPAPARLLKRGSVTAPGEILAPAALTLVARSTPGLDLPPDAPEAQRRLKFSEWLAAPANPLPARVMVNRVWQYHFGQGLVATPSDLGKSGARPSHPELLDWLASEFIRSGWSVKHLHRLIVNSATWRQSSRASEAALAKDADNQLLWRHAPHRLEAEAVRDAMLAASGRLNLQAGGPSFRPFTTSSFNATFYYPFDTDEPEFNRRTVYRMNINSGKSPLLDAFDCPDPSVKSPRRGVTTTPLQALGLMNSAFVQIQAGRLSYRAMVAADGRPDLSVNLAYRLALSRPPTAAELETGIATLKDRNFTSFCWVLLNSTEFVYVN